MKQPESAPNSERTHPLIEGVIPEGVTVQSDGQGGIDVDVADDTHVFVDRIEPQKWRITEMNHDDLTAVEQQRVDAARSKHDRQQAGFDRMLEGVGDPEVIDRITTHRQAVTRQFNEQMSGITEHFRKAHESLGSSA